MRRQVRGSKVSPESFSIRNSTQARLAVRSPLEMERLLSPPPGSGKEQPSVGPSEIIGLGFIVGGLIGLTGVGGGVLTTPLLILLFGVQPSVAIGTDLFYAAATKLTGAIKHWRQGTVDLKLAVLLGAGSLPAAVTGIVAAKIIKDEMGREIEPIITRVLAWVCILVALTLVLRVLAERTRTTGGSKSPDPANRRMRLSILILGAVTGVLVGLTSIGAGSILMVFLTMLYQMPMKRLVGTDLFHAAILAGVCALGHVWAGDVDFTLAGLLLMGSVPGVILGSRMSIRIPDVALRVSVALILGLSGTRLLVQ